MAVEQLAMHVAALFMNNLLNRTAPTNNVVHAPNTVVGRREGRRQVHHRVIFTPRP